MGITRVAVLAIGVLVFVIGLIQSGLSINNQMAAMGLLIFCLSASSYFMVGSIHRDSQGKWRLGFDCLWLLVYLSVAAICGVWLYLLNR